MKTVLSKEWNFPADHKAAMKAIIKYFRLTRPYFGKPDSRKNRVRANITQKEVENLLGLPYTSTSAFAGLWVSNTQIYMDDECEWTIEGFAMGVNGQFYAYCQDVNEKELLIAIS
jgi:hypothetical protein